MCKAYVYKVVHKETGEFYFGFRCAFKTTPENDLGVVYFTSSKRVKPRFSEFNFYILKKFTSKEEAYQYEYDLIKSEWENPLLLNQYARSKFTTANWKPSKELKQRWSIVRKGEKHAGKNNGRYGKKIAVDQSFITEEWRKAASERQKGYSNGMSRWTYVTPVGEFESISIASEKCNVNINTLIYRCKTGIQGFSRKPNMKVTNHASE